MKNIILKDIIEYSEQFTQSEDDLLLDLIKKTHSKLRYADMLSGRIVGALIRMLVKVSNAHRVLEVGTFTGYSAICLASALPDNGILFTLESNQKYADIADEYFNRSEHGHKIKLIMGPALDNISEITGEFDFVYLDADKGRYPEYYELILPKMKYGSLMLIDNAFWKGEVLNPVSKKGSSVHRLNEFIKSDYRVDNVLLTVRDGLNLIRKRYPEETSF